MITRDELFKTGDHKRIWQKYCGFLDLSLQEFMETQEQLLNEQIELVHDSPLAKKFMPRKPKDISEFRKLVPFTTYDDYAPYLSEKNEDVLAVKPYCWGHTSGRGGVFKWVPCTQEAVQRYITLGISAPILACATKKGEVNIGYGMRLLQNLPPRPYLVAIMSPFFQQRLDACVIPPLDKYENAEFEKKFQVGFQIALRTGLDVLASLTSVLVKMGERFTESSGQMKFSRYMLHPKIMFRLIKARIISKREGRAILPKDLWPIKGLMCYGTDTSIYREQLIYYWGQEPLETYGSTEAGVIAMSAWNKKNMTFVPFSCFLEFVPEGEWIKSRDDKSYQPSTVLLDEVKPGERYELIITSFYGMPFLRYRIGDLIRIIALEDEETGIKLPQMVFDSRADGIIDMAGFARLDEKTIWQAIYNTGIKNEDWSARKEYDGDKPILRLYIELKEEMDVKELERLIHHELVSLHRDYRDLEGMLGTRPLRPAILSKGSFQRYYEERKKDGAALAHLKPPHMNAPDTVIELLDQGQHTKA